MTQRTSQDFHSHSEISEYQVKEALYDHGLQYKDGERYILSQCPGHQDRSPSAQIFKDDWFVNCMAGCGRFHVTKVFPWLREKRSGETYQRSRPAYQPKKKDASESTSAMKYKQFNLIEQWEKLPYIPDHLNLKGIPAEYLNELGWRWDNGNLGMGTGMLIPYFNQDKTAIPFAQVRHLEGTIRFHFLKDAMPRLYGSWNLTPENKAIFIVEGCSDWVVMDYCGVPAIAVPSSSQTAILKKMAAYCKTAGIELIYAGDNDEAGDKLRNALDDGGFSYRRRQPPEEYNDWSDFFVAQGDLPSGVDAIAEWCAPYMYDMSKPLVLDIDMKMQENEEEKTNKLLSLFGGGDVIRLD